MPDEVVTSGILLHAAAAPAEGRPPAAASGDNGAPAETAESAPATTETPATAGDETEPEEHSDSETKPDSPKVKEIIALRRRAQKAERQLGELQAQMLAFLGNRTQQTEHPQQPQNLLPPKPDPKMYPAAEADPQYIADLAVWQVQAKAAEAEFARRHAVEQAQRQQLAVAQQQIMRTAAERVQQRGEVDPEFPQDVRSLGNMLPPSAADVVVGALARSDDAIDLVRHLLKNADDRVALSRMDIVEGLIYAGRLQERLKQARSAHSATKAPPPPKTIQGRGDGALDIYAANVPMETFAREFQRRYYGR